MKKLLTVLIVLALLGAAALAEQIDLSGMSYEDLLALRQQVDAAIWASDGWQEVEVPAGVYTIGEDIPTGRWSVSPTGVVAAITLYPDKSDYTGQTYNILTTAAIMEGESFTLDASEGNCLEIGGTVVFRPYVSAALGFH